jgi:hypothetical protein
MARGCWQLLLREVPDNPQEVRLPSCGVDQFMHLDKDRRVILISALTPKGDALARSFVDRAHREEFWLFGASGFRRTARVEESALTTTCMCLLGDLESHLQFLVTTKKLLVCAHSLWANTTLGRFLSPQYHVIGFGMRENLPKVGLCRSTFVLCALTHCILKVLH